MTDYYIATDGDDNTAEAGNIDKPWATVAGLQGDVTFTLADKMIFRAGTYNTSLEFAVSTTWCEFNSSAEVPGTIEGYAGEEVIFELPSGESTSRLFAVTNLNYASESTINIKNIKFQSGAGAITNSFLRCETNSAAASTYNFIVDGCTFFQSEDSDGDIVQLFESTSGTAGIRNVTVQNCDFTVVDISAMRIQSCPGTVDIYNNTVVVNGPGSNDSTSRTILVQSSVKDTGRVVYFRDNDITWNYSGTVQSSTTACIEFQYPDELYFINNRYELNSTDLTNSQVTDTLKVTFSDTTDLTSDLINICGNIFINNHGCGGRIKFSHDGDPATPFRGTFNFIDNQAFGNDTMRNETARDFLNVLNLRVVTINIKRNFFDAYQDFIKIDETQGTTGIFIEENVFRNIGNTEPPSAVTVPLTVQVRDYAADSIVIRNNTFFIDEHGTCIFFAGGDPDGDSCTGNHFIAINPDTSGTPDYRLTYIGNSDLPEVFLDDNYYYGVDKLSAKVFAHGTEDTNNRFEGRLDPCSVANADVTFKTTDMVKQGLVKPKGLVKRMTKDVAWQI